MRTYETVFILKPELGADAQTEHIEFYKNNITSNGGEILSVEPWGKLNLAYKVGKFSEGLYFLIQFKANTIYIEELEKRFKFNEDVIRYVVVMIDEKKFKLKPKKESIRKDRRPRTSEDGQLEDGEQLTSEDADAENVVADQVEAASSTVEEE